MLVQAFWRGMQRKMVESVGGMQGEGPGSVLGLPDRGLTLDLTSSQSGDVRVVDVTLPMMMRSRRCRVIEGGWVGSSWWDAGCRGASLFAAPRTLATCALRLSSASASHADHACSN